jgi:hypothetical protein
MAPLDACSDDSAHFRVAESWRKIMDQI